MELGLPMALGAALCFGLALVLQALGARRQAAAGGGSARGGLAATAGAMLNTPFAAGLLLDGVGFAAQLVALRTLPLYLVQSALAGALAVTAVAGAAVLGLSLSRREWAGLGAVCAGLALLGTTAGPQGTRQAPGSLGRVLLGTAVLLACVGAAAWRLAEPRRSVALGAVSGIGFGVVGLAVRTLPAVHSTHDAFALLGRPALYAVLAAGGVAFTLMTESLRGGRVTTATASMILTETTLPAVLGMVLFGDATRHGAAPAAVAAFLLAIGGAVALARFGSVEPAHTAPAPAAAPTAVLVPASVSASASASASAAQ
jgi:hypothetical protein